MVVLLLPLLLLGPDMDLRGEKHPDQIWLLQAQRHGEACPRGRCDGVPARRVPGWARDPQFGLSLGPRRDGGHRRSTNMFQWIWGHGSLPTPPSRPPVRGKLQADGDCIVQLGEDGGGPTGLRLHVRFGIGTGSEGAKGNGCSYFIHLELVHLTKQCYYLISRLLMQALHLHTQNGMMPMSCVFSLDLMLFACAAVVLCPSSKLPEADTIPHLLGLHQKYEEGSNTSMISLRGYANFALHHIYVEILESDRPIAHVAQSLENLNWNHMSVNLCSNLSTIATIFQYGHVHTHKSSINGSPIEQDYLTSYCCTRSPLIDGIKVEDTVPCLFGLCHRRWTTAPSLLILRFNSVDSLSLSSVKAIRYLQLNAHKPQVHTPEIPLGESTTVHQLVRSTNEALEDCNCSKFEPELSSDKRSLFDSSCSLWYLLCKTGSSRICSVRLGTVDSCSSLSHVILYCDR